MSCIREIGEEERKNGREVEWEIFIPSQEGLFNEKPVTGYSFVNH